STFSFQAASQSTERGSLQLSTRRLLVNLNCGRAAQDPHTRSLSLPPKDSAYCSTTSTGCQSPFSESTLCLITASIKTLNYIRFGKRVRERPLKWLSEDVWRG